jgi:MFS transporter, ACS family, tartrate transporter
VDLIEKSCMRKIYLRLLPFAILSYFLAYIDRINVSFAALTMRGDLGISAGEYGFALGTFYWGYFIFEVPSNVVLEKVGARLWIARIMITWGILAGLTAIVTGSTSFGVVRFFLGVAEAGFFPGIVLYFTYWFPTYHHARIVSGFLIGLPIAVAGGAPISTALLGWTGCGACAAGRSCISPRACRRCWSGSSPCWCSPTSRRRRNSSPRPRRPG